MDTDGYFTVPDADAVYARYQARSGKILREIEDSSYGLRDFMIETPDGHRLVFGSELAGGLRDGRQVQPT